MKKCCRCGELKPFDDFTRKAKNSDGYGSRCVPCRGVVKPQKGVPAKHTARLKHVARLKTDISRLLDEELDEVATSVLFEIRARKAANREAA